jgi:hypothetical protein
VTRPQDLAPVYPNKFVRWLMQRSATPLWECCLDAVMLRAPDVSSKAATGAARPCKLDPYPNGLLSELEVELRDLDQVKQLLTDAMARRALRP